MQKSFIEQPAEDVLELASESHIKNFVKCIISELKSTLARVECAVIYSYSAVHKQNINDAPFFALLSTYVWMIERERE